MRKEKGKGGKMANYNATSRTNYFRVTDEEKYQEIFSKLSSEAGIEDFTKTKDDGSILHGFGSYSDIVFDNEDDDGNVYETLSELQKILPEDEAFIYLESGYERLRYVTGLYIVVTKDRISSGNIHTHAIEKAREMLGNAAKEFKLDY